MENDITKKYDPLNNIASWRLDRRVYKKIENSGFDRLLGLKGPIRHNLALLSALINSYNVEYRCFVFNNHKLVFGFEDVLYITGLPVDGKPVTVTGMDLDPTALCIQYLGSNGCEGKSSLVEFKWLKNNFQVVPENIDGDSPEIEPYVRAFLLYIIGSVVIPLMSCGKVSVLYLPLLGNLQQIKDYAWGATLLAHLHLGLEKCKVKHRPSVTGHTYSLMIFAIERIPKLSLELCGNNPTYPNTFPLLKGWTMLLCEPLKNTSRRINFRHILEEIVETDVMWEPYKRLPQHFFPEYCSGQEKIGMSCTILFCYEKAVYHRPDLSPNQFGIQTVDTTILHPLVELELRSRSRPKKGVDWRTHGRYGLLYQEEWENRFICLINDSVSQTLREGSSIQHGPLPSSPQSSDSVIRQDALESFED